MLILSKGTSHKITLTTDASGDIEVNTLVSASYPPRAM